MSVFRQEQCVDRVKTVGELIEALQEFPSNAPLMDDWENNYSVKLLVNVEIPEEQYVTFQPAEED